GERHVGEAVHLGRIARDHRVEPAAAALAPRRHPVLVAHFAQKRTGLGLFARAAIFGVALLGGERTAAHTRDVGFLDAQHAVDGRGAHARARGRTARAAR